MRLIFVAVILYVAEYPKLLERKLLNCWNVKKHNSIKDLLLPLPFQLFMRQ